MYAKQHSNVHFLNVHTHTYTYTPLWFGHASQTGGGQQNDLRHLYKVCLSVYH